VDEDISMEPYALMMRQDAAFRVAVNRAISTIYRSPAIDGLYERWFGGFGKPGALLGAMYYLAPPGVSHAQRHRFLPLRGQCRPRLLSRRLRHRGSPAAAPAAPVW
jgi:hypothetical protein